MAQRARLSGAYYMVEPTDPDQSTTSEQPTPRGRSIPSARSKLPQQDIAAYTPTARKENPQEITHVRTNGFRRYRSLVWMILSFICGAALAVGHHYFYASFNGQRVDSASLSQIWILRIGTGLAFFVKMFLVVSASMACTQYQWLTTKSKQFKIRQLDTIFSILGNALGFLESRVWLRFPVLSLLAVITWLLPIAAVITPASITVVLQEETTVTLSNAPQLFLDPNQYGNLQTLVRRDYLGPSTDVNRAAFGSAMTGQILNIPSAEPNMSYTLEFVGPALRCDHANASLIDQVYDAYMDQLTGIENQYYYISWVPTTNGRLNLTATSQVLDLASPDTAHIYIIPNTSVAGPIFVGGIQVGSGPYGYEDLLDCKLYNASYEALFNFSYPSQIIDVRSRKLLNPVNASIDISEWYSSDERYVVEKQAQRICYQSIMESLGNLLVGNSWLRDGFDVTDKSSWAMMSINWTNRATAQQGVEELFQNITLSMLSSTSLIMNATVAAQNQIPINIYSTFNVYSYNASDLWLAYGIAAGATLLCTAFGLYAIWRNGAAYQNLFSTFLRTTTDYTYQALIDPADNGAEPLPKHLAEASIRLAEK